MLALGLAGCGGSSHPTGATVAATGTALRTPAVTRARIRTSTSRKTGHPPAPHLPPVSAGAGRMKAALERVLRGAGPNSGVLVYDLTARKVLFALREGVRRPPASVEKIYTTVALLRMLHPQMHLHTTVLGTGHLGPGGVWHGDLYLRGGGDPTFGDEAFNKAWYHGAGTTAAELADQLRAHGIRRVTGRVFGDDSLLDSRPGGPGSGYRADVPDYAGELGALGYDHGSVSGKLTPAAFAVRQLARVLRAQHVSAQASARTRRTPRGAHRLASVSSPPLSVLIKLMDVPSDDLFAEDLTELLGLHVSHVGTVTAGAKVIGHVIASYGIHPAIVDGSGLSRADETSPADVVALLRKVWHTPIGNELSSSLPVVGVSGTVQAIARRSPAKGNCVAKTGTLNYVTNLAGYCERRGHHAVAFAVFIDGPENWQATTMEGKMVAAIARY